MEVPAMIHVEEIDHRAVIHGDVKIGKGTRVWQFASVIRGAVLGEDCSIASCAIVDSCRLGDRVIVSHGAFLDPGMKIGSDVFIGPHVIFCNDCYPRYSKVGWFTEDELFSSDLVVSEVCDHANIGAGAILLPGVRIGENALVAAGAVVTKSVPKDMVYRRDGSIHDLSMGERKRYLSL